MISPYAKTRAFRLATSPWKVATVAAVVMAVGCDQGIAPPDQERVGTISGSISYSAPWPSANEFVEIRFVALRFVPQDTADFLQLNRIEFSRPLTYGLPGDTFTIANVPVGFFPYSGVARQATDDIFSWGPIGLLVENDGVFSVTEGETTRVHVDVDFANPPDFPKQPMSLKHTPTAPDMRNSQRRPEGRP
jgi:hypothetical protein